jgi:Holliday junction resolvase YEN1
MGIQLFDVIREHEEIVPIAQLAAEHHERHGRPLRIAVDEADWRFNNVTQAQVYAIRNGRYHYSSLATMLTYTASDTAYQGQEKIMFQRICRFLTLNIQLIFVFDGPGRPWKRGGRGGGKIDYQQRDLLKEVLRHLGVPYHEAPGEAEAECARMQIVGMVDAVWSQDSDCIMFGCTLWIRDDRVVKEKGTKDLSKENTQKSKKTARVVKAQTLKDRLQIDREGLVLFAMLVGGDYDTKGLPGCGPSMALKMIKKGLGPSLCACRSQRECDAWSMLLTECLYSSGGRAIDVPPRFPDFKTLVKYNTPKVTSDEVLKNNAKLNLDNMRPINELKLLEVTSSRFNMWGRKYMNCVGPVLLTRSLSSRSSTLPREVVHGIKLVKERPKKTDSGLPAPVFERKLSFSPFGVTTLRKEDFEGERLGYWNGDAKELFDPNYRVEMRELPIYWLQKVLPPDVLDSPPAEPKAKSVKRKKQAEATEASDPPAPAKKQRKTTEGSDPPATVNKQRKTAGAAPSSSTAPGILPQKKPSKQRRKESSAVVIEDLIELSDSDDELRLPPPRSVTKSSARSAVSQVIDFGSPSSSETELDVTQPAAVGRHPVQRTPSRNKADQQAPWPDFYEIEERDLQLALRASLQERTATLPSRPYTGNDESTLFDVSPLSSPSGFMPQHPIPTATRETYATPSKSSPLTPEPGIKLPRPALTNTADHGLSATQTPPAKPSTSHNTSSGSSGTPKAESGSFQRESAVSNCAEGGIASPAALTAEEVWGARLRHFQNPATSSPANPQPTIHSRSNATPNRTAQSTFNIPSGAACIDLTDD